MAHAHVYVIATLDTKGAEAAFVCERLRAQGVTLKLVDASCFAPPQATADIPRDALFRTLQTTAAEIAAQGDRGYAVSQAAEAAARLVADAHQRGEVSGVLAIGGSAGTTIGTAAMRALPLGVPKVMVSTLASGNVRPWVGDKDILMLNSVVDIAGLNRISRKILANAAAAMAGMLAQPLAPSSADKPLIAATMFGVTTPCITYARELLEAAGYEVLVFHATGSGGQAMESLIGERVLAGVLDVTTTELADELVGGILSAGPTRLTAAAQAGVPQVVSVGALDMVNFGPRETVPAKFASRRFHVHNATVTLMRTTPHECAQLGAELGRKVAASSAPAAIVLPHQGVSALDRAGQPFDDPVARAAMFEAIRNTHGNVELLELPHHINDPDFAAALVNKLLALISGC
jgi:uncharacterized protein (UPF0261 family)